LENEASPLAVCRERVAMWGGESRHRDQAGKTYFEKNLRFWIHSETLIF
jgi:hypothetical protein